MEFRPAATGPGAGTRGAELITSYRTFAESGALYRVNENDWPLV